jgi:hypothetical protein
VIVMKQFLKKFAITYSEHFLDNIHDVAVRYRTRSPRNFDVNGKFLWSRIYLDSSYFGTKSVFGMTELLYEKYDF